MITNSHEQIVTIFDADKTLLPGYSIIDFAEFLKNHHCFSPSTWNKFQHLLESYKHKQLDYNAFANEVVRLYAEGVRGQHIKVIQSLSGLFWRDRVQTLYPFVQPLFAELNTISAKKILISGSTLESLSGLIQSLRFQEIHTTLISTAGSVFLGTVKTNTASEKEKSKTVDDIFARHPKAITIGFGDSAADLSFLHRVSHPIVVGSHDSILQQKVIKDKWINIEKPEQTYAFSVTQLLTQGKI